MNTHGGGNGCRAVGDLLVDVLRRRVTVGARCVPVTAKEFDLLATLAEHPGWVFSREQLFTRVWSSDYVDDTRVVAVHIGNLRRKLGDSPNRPRYLHTVRGAGYKLEYASEAQADKAEPFSGEQTERPPAGDCGDAAAGLRMQNVFIGRRRETATLMQALEEVLSGAGRSVLISGEPGIGKTRLAEEFEARARARGASVIWGQVAEEAASPAFWPYILVLRQLLADTRDQGGTGADIAGMIDRLAPEALEVRPDLADAASLNPAEARFRLFRSVAEVFQAVSSLKPLVVVIDDIHWAAVPSLLLLDFLVRELRTSRVLLVLTYRDSEIDTTHPLRRLLGSVIRQRGVRRIRLDGLSEAEVGLYLQSVSSGDPSQQLVSQIHQRSDGNPFFLEEILRTFVSDSVPPTAGENGGWFVTIPVEVRGAILSRLDRLSPEARQAVFVAALVGRQFDLDVLRQVMGVAQDDLLELLQESEQAHLIQGTRVAGIFRFRHELTREALYDELPCGERMHLHQRVGLALERLHAGDLSEHMAALAHHFSQAGPVGPPRRAIEYCITAARLALDRFAYEVGAEYYDQALCLLEIDEKADDRQRCTLLLGLGDALMRAGSARGRDAFRAAGAIAERLDDPTLLARAVLQYDGRTVGPAGVDLERVRLLERAVQAQSGDDSALMVRLLALLAKSLAELGDSIAPADDPYSSERRRRVASESAAMARRLRDPDALEYALTATHMAVHRPDNLDVRLAEAQEIVRLSLTSGNRLAALCAYFFWHNDLLEAGALDQAAQVLEEFRSLAHEFRLEYHIGYAEIMRSNRLGAEGRFLEAELVMENEAIPRLLLAEQPRFAAIARWSGRFMPFLLCGDGCTGQELEARLRELTLGDPIGWAWSTRLARLLAHLGRHAESRRLFEQLAARDFGDVPPVEGHLPFLAHLSETAVLLEDQRRAEILFQMLAPYEDRGVCTMQLIEGLVSYELAILTSLLARFPQSEAYFERTVARAGELGLMPQLALAQAGWAEMRLRRDAGPDRHRAAVLADDCLRLCLDLGMDTLAERARHLQAQAAAGSTAGTRRLGQRLR